MSLITVVDCPSINLPGKTKNIDLTPCLNQEKGTFSDACATSLSINNHLLSDVFLMSYDQWSLLVAPTELPHLCAFLIWYKKQKIIGREN
jgi:hypothetical protein